LTFGPKNSNPYSILISLHQQQIRQIQYLTRMCGKAQPDGRPVVEFIEDDDSRQTVNF